MGIGAGLGPPWVGTRRTPSFRAINSGPADPPEREGTTWPRSSAYRGIDKLLRSQSMEGATTQSHRERRRRGPPPPHPTTSIVAFTRRRAPRRPAGETPGEFTNPERTIFAVKRLSGRRYDDPMVERTRSSYPTRITRRQWRLRGRGGRKGLFALQIPPSTLQKIRRTRRPLSAKSRAGCHNGTGHFNDAQRQATKDAAKIAGLKACASSTSRPRPSSAYGIESRRTGTIARSTTSAAAPSIFDPGNLADGVSR